jgi:nucleoid-associated protein YgaU
MVPSRLPAGSYELRLIARLPDGTVASSKQGVMVTVNDVGANSGATQSRAEYVPETASRAAAPPQPPLRAAKLQENAAFRSAHAMAVGSTSDKGLSTPATGRKILTRVVSRGDSLWRISRITYGDGTRYAVVYRANRDRIRDPNLIHPGQVLLVPKRH